MQTPLKNIDKYERIQCLHQGKFVYTYLAKHIDPHIAEEQGGTVLLILLHPKFAADRRYVQTFRKETAVRKRVHHPALPKVLDEISSSHLCGRVLSHHEEPTLSEIIAYTQGPLHKKRIQRIFSSVVDVLAHIHSFNVVHASLSPESILVHTDDSITLINTAYLPTSKTSKQEYLSPELYTPKSHPTASGDRYALGLILHQLLTGQLPWGHQESRISIQKRKEQSSFLSHSAVQSPQNAIFWRAFRGLTHQNPKIRMHFSDLQLILSNLARTKEASPKSTPRASKNRSHSLRKRLFPVLAISFLLMIGIVLWYQPSPSPDPEDSLSTNDAIAIQADQFAMGCPPNSNQCFDDETPLHMVHLHRNMLVMQSEVTQDLYTNLMGKNPSYFQDCGLSCPVEQVDWFDALQMANALSIQDELTPCYIFEDSTALWSDRNCSGWRLPTEAEWEFITQTMIAAGSGDAFSSLHPKPHPVCSFHGSGDGICDLLGNVWEWTWDGSHRIYSEQDEYDPIHNHTTNLRIVKGGAWSSYPDDRRQSIRVE